METRERPRRQRTVCRQVIACVSAYGVDSTSRKPACPPLLRSRQAGSRTAPLDCVIVRRTRGRTSRASSRRDWETSWFECDPMAAESARCTASPIGASSCRLSWSCRRSCDRRSAETIAARCSTTRCGCCSSPCSRSNWRSSSEGSFVERGL